MEVAQLQSKIDSLCIAQSDIASLQRVALANHCREFIIEGLLYSLHEVVEYTFLCVCVDLFFIVCLSDLYVKVDWSETVFLHS